VKKPKIIALSPFFGFQESKHDDYDDERIHVGNSFRVDLCFPLHCPPELQQTRITVSQ